LKTAGATRTELKRYLAAAIAIAQEGGAFLKRKYGHFRELDEKPDAGLVTEADRGAEKLIFRRLHSSFPSHALLGEESGGRPGSSRLRWIVDPLDGTTNFVHGFPQFCVSIGLEREGRPLVGVVFNPILGDLYWAAAGMGARRNGRPLGVSQVTHLKDALITTGFSYRKEKGVVDKEVRAFARMVSRTQALRRTGSAALDLCYVASGHFDGFYERELSPWDVAAGILIVREAGGRVTDFKGKPHGIHTPTMLASNGRIHGDLLDLVR
jgi:myo-inositol-1(or 4)-monophosphatase